MMTQIPNMHAWDGIMERRVQIWECSKKSTWRNGRNCGACVNRLHYLWYRETHAEANPIYYWRLLRRYHNVTCGSYIYQTKLWVLYNKFFCNKFQRPRGYFNLKIYPIRHQKNIYFAIDGAINFQFQANISPLCAEKSINLNLTEYTITCLTASCWIVWDQKAKEPLQNIVSN